MRTIRWTAGLIRRRHWELLGAVLSLALAVALIASLGAFVSSSRASLTDRAVARIPVDWQVQVTPQGSAAAVTAAVRAAPHVRAVLPVTFARVPALTSDSVSGRRTTGAAYVVALPPEYADVVRGGMRHFVGASTGTLVQQQTAANLAAGPGSTITVRPPSGSPVHVTVDGVADLTAPDAFFQIVGAPAGAGATAPPDNVLFVAPGQFAALTAGSAPIQQFHVLLDHAALPTDPGPAAAAAAQQSHRLAAELAGAGLIGDNLEASLLAAREDALYAQLLFLLLGLPGLALAAVVAVLVTALRTERRRREAAVLRLRGAPPGAIARLIGAETVLTAIGGALVGLPLGVLLVRLALGAGTPIPGWWAVAAVAGGAVLAAATQLGPLLWAATRGDVDVATELARRSPTSQPLVLRLGLDLVLLAAAGLVFWLTARGKYQVVVVPEGLPVASVNYAALLAPALAWPGLALLVWRLTALALSRRTGRFVRESSGRAPELEAAAVRRRRRTIARGATGLAVAVALSISTAIFTATYDEQSRLDVALTVGSDVAVTGSTSAGVPPGLAARIAAAPGAEAVEAMQHRLAYVGPDLQDLYGIDPSTIGRAAPLRDSYVPGSTIDAALADLAARPDGVLLSQETLNDYQLQPGDLIRLRLQTASAPDYAPVDFHVVGLVTEFPTAPRDSFIVANAAYLTQVTGSEAAATFLVKSSTPVQTAAALREALGADAQVSDIVSSRDTVTTATGLAAADLGGLARIELGFGIVLALACSGLALALGVLERRRALVLLAALGATTRQRGRFLAAEARALVVPGMLGGILVGVTLAYLLTKVLTGIFDPPPTGLTIPLTYLAGLLLTVAVVSAIAVAIVGRLASRAGPSQLRDL